jgi:hypothetical protein
MIVIFNDSSDFTLSFLARLQALIQPAVPPPTITRLSIVLDIITSIFMLKANMVALKKFCIYLGQSIIISLEGKIIKYALNWPVKKISFYVKGYLLKHASNGLTRITNFYLIVCTYN